MFIGSKGLAQFELLKNYFEVFSVFWAVIKHGRTHKKKLNMNVIPVISPVNHNPPFPSKWPEVRVGAVPVCVQVAIQVNDLNLFDVLDL